MSPLCAVQARSNYERVVCELGRKKQILQQSQRLLEIDNATTEQKRRLGKIIKTYTKKIKKLEVEATLLRDGCSVAAVLDEVIETVVSSAAHPVHRLNLKPDDCVRFNCEEFGESKRVEGYVIGFTEDTITIQFYDPYEVCKRFKIRYCSEFSVIDCPTTIYPF